MRIVDGGSHLDLLQKVDSVCGSFTGCCSKLDLGILTDSQVLGIPRIEEIKDCSYLKRSGRHLSLYKVDDMVCEQVHKPQYKGFTYK